MPTTIRSLPLRTRAGLATLAGAVFVAVSTETLPTGLLPQIGAGLGVDQARAGLLVGVYALVVALTSVPLAAVTNGLPRKGLLLATVTGYTLSSLLVAGTHSFTVALVARVVGGLAHAVFFAVAAAYTTRLVPPAMVGRAVAATLAGSSLALVLGVPLGTAIGLRWGWRAGFVLLAVVGLALLVLAARLLPPVPSSVAVSRQDVVRALRVPGLGTVGVVAAVAFAGHYTAYTYISPLLHRGGLGGTSVAAVLLLFGVAGAGGVWLAGVGADTRARPLLLGSLAAVAGVMVAVWAAAGLPVVTVAAVVLWGLGFGAVPAVVMTAGLRAGHRHPDISAAVVNSTCNVGIAAGAALGGGELAHGGLTGVPVLAAVVLVAAVAVVGVARRPFAGVPAAS